MKSPRTAVALVVVVRTSKTLRYPSSRFVVPVVVAFRVRRGDGDGDVPVPRTAATILPPVVVVLVVLNVVSAVGRLGARSEWISVGKSHVFGNSLNANPPNRRLRG